MAKKTTSTTRDKTIDILRAVAIITMTYTHSVVFFHDFSNNILLWFSDIGGNISFTLFLFCFGAAIYYSFLKNPTKEKRNKLLKRAGLWLLIYYVLAFLGRYTEHRSLTAGIFWQILTFSKIVPFTEFFIAFPLILIITLIIPRLTTVISKNPFILGLFSFALYILGSITVQLLTESSIISLFVGYKTLHYFPVLFYSSIYLLGINYALSTKNSDKSVFSSMGLILTIIFYFISQLVGQFSRFPPSIQFLMYGLIFTYGILFAISIFESIKHKWVQKILDLLQKLGNRALTVFMINTVILFAYKYFLHNTSFSQWYIVLLLWLVGLVTSALSQITL
ncbi:DUF1624 domain-containing protein [Candidatus Dojkabacteria bacterium]|nr:DUF1624 domain-containing protein [Candidatus Dojkabacteria bacterium]